MHDPRILSPAVLAQYARAALAEDVGSGDATTLAVVPAVGELTAVLRTREACVVAGMALVVAVFHELDDTVVVEPHCREGERLAPGATLATITGSARAILTGERTALNYLQRLCGIATLTRRFVDAIHPRPTRLLDTRKTTPGLRALEKYAVAAGGGENHRFGLFDRILIKDNHLAVAAWDGPGGIARAVQASRRLYPQLQVEVEADTLDQVREALHAHADYVLLDNMTCEEMADAVALRNQLFAQALLEASGGMTLERVPEVAATGVDFISVGALTHSARAIDLGLDITVTRRYPDTAG